MIPLPLARIAEITSGALSRHGRPSRRGARSRRDRLAGRRTGILFVALQGARVDGHDFAAQAIAAGAVAVLAARPVEAPAVIVADDAAVALAALATRPSSPRCPRPP